VRGVALDCLKHFSLRLKDATVVQTVASSIVKILQGGAEGGKVRNSTCYIMILLVRAARYGTVHTTS
jgi:hypothetical protein